MTTFNTIEASLKTNKAEIIKVTEITVRGIKRLSIKAKRANGSKVFTVVGYENGTFSSAV